MSWKPKPQQNAKALRLFVETMEDINDSFYLSGSDSLVNIPRVARHLAVPLRKLLLDGRPLVHSVLQGPRFHPLFHPSHLSGDTYTNTRTFQVQLATNIGVPLSQPARHSWSITVHPLHGLSFNNTKKAWSLQTLFDTEEPPVTLQRWTKQKLFCVDEREYTLGDTLLFIANKEAAHVDTEKSERSVNMERVHFGFITYYHLITVLTAAYIRTQYALSSQTQGDLWNNFATIKESPTEITGRQIAGEINGAEIDPMGLPEAMHETGIPVPEPGRPWQPVQIEETAVVYVPTPSLTSRP